QPAGGARVAVVDGVVRSGPTVRVDPDAVALHAIRLRQPDELPVERPPTGAVRMRADALPDELDAREVLDGVCVSPSTGLRVVARVQRAVPQEVRAAGRPRAAERPV